MKYATIQLTVLAIDDRVPIPWRVFQDASSVGEN